MRHCKRMQTGNTCPQFNTKVRAFCPWVEMNKGVWVNWSYSLTLVNVLEGFRSVSGDFGDKLQSMFCSAGVIST